MSTHPNAILALRLTPEGLSRKTMMGILADAGRGLAYDGSLRDISISGKDYHCLIMESAYNESYQVSAQEGDLLFFDFVTYGYGETITWDALEKQKNELSEWAASNCPKHHCQWEIFVTANYW